MQSVYVLTLLTTLLQLTVSSDTWQTVRGKVKIPQIPRPPTMKIVLNDGSATELTTMTRVDGSFALDNINPGIYTLQIISTKYHFGKYKVEVTEKRIRTVLYPYVGAERVPSKHPLRIEPLGMRGYFENRPVVGIGYFLKNPMMLMMLFSVGMMYLMPKMMPTDPEELKKIQEEQAEMMKKAGGGGLASMFGLGGKDDEEDE
tara:strand:+ start:32 stop:637 length:606 start_codon:yes stop_codon:yes gene_type:complete